MSEIYVVKQTKKGPVLVPKYPAPKEKRLISHTPEGLRQEATVRKFLRGTDADVVVSDNIGTLCPYPVAPSPVPDVPIRIDGVYPYEPSSSTPDAQIPFNIGTLLPPRPKLTPWKTSAQRLFRAGDAVYWRVTGERGLIVQIYGEQAVIAIDRKRYRIPIQDLVLLHGSIQRLYKVEQDDETAKLGRRMRR